MPITFVDIDVSISTIYVALASKRSLYKIYSISTLYGIAIIDRYSIRRISSIIVRNASLNSSAIRAIISIPS